jgi:hypothetical protein
MRYQYLIHGRNHRPLWGFTKRNQGRQVRYCLDMGWIWVACYWSVGR